MNTLQILATLLFTILFSFGIAQQVPDTTFTYQLEQSVYPLEMGPVVCIDEAHHNFHTKDSGFRPFAELLEHDGYRVKAVDKSISEAGLNSCEIFVIANALHKTNAGNWVLPTPSAFSDSEIASLKSWVQGGGKLLLIADHMPFAGAANQLAMAFGFEYLNGFARTGPNFWPPAVFTPDNGLLESPPRNGLNDSEFIDRVATFTGSAFTIPDQAVPVIAFSTGHESLQPDTAWRFNETTEIQDLENYYQGALLEFGKGKIAVFGEAAMFTAQIANQNLKVGFNSEYAPQNAQFVLNVIHWLDGVEIHTGPKHQYPLSPAEQAIMDQNQALINAFDANDFLAVAAIYSDDAVLVGNKQTVEGRTTIDSYWLGLKDRGVSWELENTHLEVHGDVAFQRGISRMAFQHEGKVHQSDVRFTLVWKRIAGEWKIAVDHYSLL